jgi:pimeloyl-ACP methyl ester carboxylesterase
LIQATPPRLRRAYYDCRYGQLHVHNAIPAGGGFDELTTLVCVHDRATTGAQFAGVLAGLGAERSIYAPDLPGTGQTDAAPGATWAEAGAHAIGDFLDSMRIRRIDVLASGDGAEVAALLLAQRSAALRRYALLDPPAVVPAPAPGLTLPPSVTAVQRIHRLREFFGA